MSNGALHNMAMVEESTYGTTPGSPTMETVRHNSTTLNLSKDVIKSEELRSDRMPTDSRHGPHQIGGDIVSEISWGGNIDTILEAVVLGTWANETPASGTDQLKAATTRRSFTIRRHFGDLDSGNAYHIFTGCEFNSVSISMTPGAIVTMTFGIIGQGQSTQASEISGATITSATTSEAMTAIEGSILEGGSTIGTVTDVSLEVNNGMDTRFSIGSDETLQPSVGRATVTGTMTAYFEDQALLDKFINETNSSLDVRLQDTAGNQYRFYCPNIVYTSGQPDVEGEGPIVLSMGFDAVLDSTEATNLIIERTAA